MTHGYSWTATVTQLNSAGVGILVRSAEVPLTPQQQWYENFGLPTNGSGDGSSTGNPDQDVFDNEEEYVLGLSPVAGNPIEEVIVPETAGGEISFEFSRYAERQNFMIAVEYSENLTDWFTAAASATGEAFAVYDNRISITETGSNPSMVKATLNVNATEKTFIRVVLRAALNEAPE